MAMARRQSSFMEFLPPDSRELVGLNTLDELFAATLPDKKAFFQEWLDALAAPAVCIASIDDVRRLDMEDIAALPVPPLAKGVFREVLNQQAAEAQQQDEALKATASRARAFLAPQRDRHMQPSLAGSKYFQDARNYRLILTREEIDAGVRIAARRIETWSKGERIVVVAILKGAFMFLSDLCRTFVRPYSVYFVDSSSYGESKSQGSVKLSADINPEKFVDKSSGVPHKVVIIDELMDNGKTMNDVKQHFLSTLKDTHAENDVLTCCLFAKDRERSWPEADVTGIPKVPDLWLVGYGLDDRGTKRGWTELLAVPKVKLVETILQSDVEALLANLDENAALLEPCNFAGASLTQKQFKFKVCSLDTTGDHARAQPSLGERTPRKAELKKADIEQIIAGLAVMGGKYEENLQFSFIADNMPLVPEDEIFQGNNLAYAQMRCRLHNQVAAAARKCSVEEPPPIAHS